MAEQAKEMYTARVLRWAAKTSERNPWSARTTATILGSLFAGGQFDLGAPTWATIQDIFLWMASLAGHMAEGVTP